MTDLAEPQFPYIERDAQRRQVERVLVEVAGGGASQVVLVQGGGGVGKTYFIRGLPDQLGAERFRWLGPFDMDDAEYWLLSNLQSDIVQELEGHTGEHFAAYRTHEQKVPKLQRERISLEQLLAHSRQGEQIFRECYGSWVRAHGITPVLVLDTVEAIQGLDVITRLVRWLKQLTGTVVILATRPPPPVTAANGETRMRVSPLVEELERTPPVAYTRIVLERFSEVESLQYLASSAIAGYLPEASRRALAGLADNTPLWLAMGLSYLGQEGELPELRGWLERGADDAEVAERLRADYVRRLMVPYARDDFWAEAVKRLGIIRRRVDRGLWGALMADMRPPDDAPSLDAAWEKLCGWPWIRKRAKSDYITLHDAVAEALASRIIPLDDQDGSWRTELWAKAVKLYEARVGALSETEGHGEPSTHELIRDLLRIAAEESEGRQDRGGVEAEAVFIPPEQARAIAREQAERSLLVSTHFHYLALSDREAAMVVFPQRFDEASKRGDSRLIQLLWIELQRLIADEGTFDPLSDVVAPASRAFREWFWRADSSARDMRLDVGGRLATFLNQHGRPSDALAFVDRLVAAERRGRAGDPTVADYLLQKARANAVVRIPGQALEAEAEFLRALSLAESAPEGTALAAWRVDALIEMAWYLRITGHWRRATGYCLHALEAMPLHDLDMQCQGRLQYAYLKALLGDHNEAETAAGHARNLAEMRLKALAQQEQPDNQLARRAGFQLSGAFSMYGLVLRHDGQLVEAHKKYSVSRRLVERLGRQNSLAEVLSSLVVTMNQAIYTGVELPGFSDLGEQRQQALILAEQAVDLCRDYNMRELPVALNRAGTIHFRLAASLTMEHVQRALGYLREGIQVATELADEWMLVASEVALATVGLEVWLNERDRSARELFEAQREPLNAALQRLDQDAFLLMRGRWEILQAQLALADYLEGERSEPVRSQLRNQAFQLHRTGYIKLVRGAGDRRSKVVQSEVAALKSALSRMTLADANGWLQQLDGQWREPPTAEDAWLYEDKGIWLSSLRMMLSEVAVELTAGPSLRPGS